MLHQPPRDYEPCEPVKKQKEAFPVAELIATAFIIFGLGAFAALSKATGWW